MSTVGASPRALVTGSNRGIGLALCGLLAERGYDVLATCRRSSLQLHELGVKVIDGVDVGARDAADRIRGAIANEPIHFVVANAAQNRSFDVELPDDLDLDLFEDDLRVNVVGAARTVLTALPSMKPGARVMLVSSGVVAPGRIVRGNFGYQVTKAALNQFGQALAQYLRPRGIVVATVAPGPTNTAMLRTSFAAGQGELDPADAADPYVSAGRMLDVVEAAPLETSGSFWNFNGDVYLGPDGRAPES